MFNRTWIPPITRATLVVTIIFISYFILDFTLPLIYPFLISFAIALLINPAVNLLERRFRFPRWAAVTVILLLVLSIILSLVIFLVAEIVVGLTQLSDFLPTALETFGKKFTDTFTQENTSMRRIIDTVQSYLEQNPSHREQITTSLEHNIGVIANNGTNMITKILSAIGIFLSELPFFLTVLVFITLAAFFISLDWKRLNRGIGNLMPNRVQSTGGLVFQDMKKALMGFLRAQITLITITALIMLTGLFILRVPYAITIALIIGVVDLLPYLGVGAVLVPWITYALLVGDIRLGIGLAIVYGIIIVVRQALEPKLVASNVGLDPLLTLIALFIGLQLFGFFGLIIGPVFVVILLALHRAHVFRDIWQYIIGNDKPDNPRS
ncbi:sporulation integral membrane protein YtvI [Polycladospora coralii]|uniref:sporulation integral membrane protein YtvI n=1 Tax=Polycladospora coralii TaxID=2771432 RepID=UPI001CD0A4A4|nr:sporulation integral membrane protein YtvI [Polycladospora coralii]